MAADTPAKVALNLDTAKRPDKPKPFTVVLDGERYLLADAQELDYRVLLDSQRTAFAGDAQQAIDLVIAESDRESFLASRMPAWKLRLLFDAYNQHYGINSDAVQ